MRTGTLLPRRILASLAGLACLALALSTAAPATGRSWKPGPARYGIGKHGNVPVKMRDGTILRANVHYPTDRSSRKPARGPFPVIMVQTPYGKDSVGAFSGQSAGPQAGTEAGPLPYLIERGYIDVSRTCEAPGIRTARSACSTPFRAATALSWCDGPRGSATRTAASACTALHTWGSTSS